MNIEQFLTATFWNNTGQEYLYALCAFFIALILIRVFKNVVVWRMHRIAKKTKSNVDDIFVKSIREIHWPFYTILSIYIASKFLTVNAVLMKAIDYILLIFVTFYAGLFLHHLVGYGAEMAIKKREDEKKNGDIPAIMTLAKIGKIFIWIAAATLILANMGYDISTIIAGLGIGGLAIALALQNVLSDIFAAFSIYLDKPFQIGDFIIVGSDMGVVKKIGIKSTRITTLQGQELIISNQELTSARINNYKKMRKRRIQFGIGVVYGTKTEKLKKIPKMVEKIFNKVDLADLDRVHFKSFGDFSLNYEIVYYLRSSDYNKYMDTQQEINLRIKEAFEKAKIEMAFPTQTVYLEK